MWKKTIPVTTYVLEQLHCEIIANVFSESGTTYCSWHRQISFIFLDWFFFSFILIEAHSLSQCVEQHVVSTVKVKERFRRSWSCCVVFSASHFDGYIALRVFFRKCHSGCWNDWCVKSGTCHQGHCQHTLWFYFIFLLLLLFFKLLHWARSLCRVTYLLHVVTVTEMSS